MNTNPKDNYSPTGHFKVVHSTPKREMHHFDRLPKVFRDLLKEAPISLSSFGIREILKTHTEREALLIFFDELEEKFPNFSPVEARKKKRI